MLQIIGTKAFALGFALAPVLFLGVVVYLTMPAKNYKKVETEEKGQ